MAQRSLLLALAFLMPALAGCIGGDAPQPPDDGDGDAPPAQVSETTGAIEGEVLDGRSLLPLRDAMVGVLQDKEVVAQVTTDRQGRYAVSELEPGKYQVTVNAIGFRTMARAAEVKAGEVARVSALLEPLPDEAPREELFEFEGFMAFGADTPLVATTWGMNDPNHAVRFDFDVDPSFLETVIVEARWNNNAAGLRAYLWLNPNCEPVCEPDHEYGYGEGFGSLAFRVDHDMGTWPKLDGTNVTLSVQFWSERGSEAVTAAFQQGFQLHIGAFYVERAAEGRVVMPEF